MENENPNQNPNPNPNDQFPYSNNNPNPQQQQNFGTGNQNQNQYQNQYQNPNPNINNQPNLPNSIGVLVLGIVSLVVWFCYGIPGIICAIIALVLSKRPMDEYNANPSMYSLSSYNNVKAGKICATIGLILGILWFILIICIIVFGAAHSYSRYSF